MTAPTARTVAQAILILEICASNNTSTRCAALDLGLYADSDERSLALWAFDQVRADDVSTIYLEAAARLRDGWRP